MSVFQTRYCTLTSTCISSFREVLCAHECFIAIIVMIHKSQVLDTKQGWRWSPEILLAGVLVKANKKTKFYICGMEQTNFDTDVTTAVAGNQI